MLTFLEFFRLHEEFNNVLDFLLNPEHRHKTWSELMKEFEASGGEFIGGGKYGSVFSHPRWNYVIKKFNDPYYLKFVRFAYSHPHPSFPKFFGLPQHIIPFYRRGKSSVTTYIVRIEKLNPVTDKVMMDAIIKDYWNGIHYLMAVERGAGDQEQEIPIYPSFDEMRKGIGIRYVKEKVYQNIFNVFEKYPKIRSLFEAIYLINNNVKAAMDIHPGNIMQRDNGDLVLTDPSWEGSNPYKDYQRMMDLEIGAYDDYEEPENIVGGELPKRIKKRKPRKSNYTDEIPF